MYKSEADLQSRRVKELEDKISSSSSSSVGTPSDVRSESSQIESQKEKEESDKYKKERQENEAIIVSHFENTIDTLIQAKYIFGLRCFSESVFFLNSFYF